MRKAVAASGLIVLATLAGAVGAQRPLPPDSVVRTIIRQRVDEGRSAGIVVGLIDPNGKTRTVAYGRGAAGAALDEHSVFEIGSITKTFTAAILADMVAKGEVRLDEPVAALLPTGAKVPSRGGRQITLLDLATQSSGFPRLPDNFAPKDAGNPYIDYDGNRLLAFLARYELPREPGTKYEYSNLGVGLLGYALSARAGVPYERLVTDRVLWPLGMTESGITLTAAMGARLAPGHAADGKPARPWDWDALAGAGALRSTVHDMLRYTAANLNPRASSLGAVLEATHTKRFQTEVPNMSLGLAWHRMASDRGDTIVWHDGGTGGYKSMVAFDARRHVGVIVLSSTATDVSDIALHLMDARIPLTRPSAHTEIALSPDSLQRFVGVYQLTPAMSASILRYSDYLVIQATGQPAIRLFPEAATKFFLKDLDAQIAFESDAGGTVTGFVLTQEGVQTRALRTNAATVAPAAPPPRMRPRASAVDSIRALDTAWARAYVSHDTALAGAIFASDLVVTDAAGRVHGRTAELGDVGPTPGLQMEYYRTEDVAVQVDERAAVVTGVVSWRFTLNGQATALRRRYTANYSRGGPLGWRMVALQMRAVP